MQKINILIGLLIFILTSESHAQSNDFKKWLHANNENLNDNSLKLIANFHDTVYNFQNDIRSFFHNSEIVRLSENFKIRNFGPRKIVSADGRSTSIITVQNESKAGYISINKQYEYLKIDTSQAKKIFKILENTKNKNLTANYYLGIDDEQLYYFGETSNDGTYGFLNGYGNFYELYGKRLRIPHGNGVMVSISSGTGICEIYEGQFKNGKKDGFGKIYYFSIHNSLERAGIVGNFSFDKLNGFAKKIWADGTYYFGKWTNNNLTGIAEMNIVDIGKYSGFADYMSNPKEPFLKDAKTEGLNGILIKANNDTLYSDQFINFKANGRGVLKNKEFIFEGEFKNDDFHGMGIQKFYNGKIFAGTWVQNKKTGEFIETSTNGTKNKSLWNKDKLLAVESDPSYSKIASYPNVLKEIYLIDKGIFLNSLKKSKINGRGSITSFSGTFVPDYSGFLICDISIGADGNRYNTINCVELESFELKGNSIRLTFTGSVSKITYQSTVKLIRGNDGKMERKIISNGQSFETVRLNLSIDLNMQGIFKNYTICFEDQNGRQNCGLGTYNGNLEVYKN